MPSGKKNSVRAARNLFALWGSLSYDGSSLDAKTVSRRLGVSQDAASRLLGLIVSSKGNDDDYLSLYSADDQPDHDVSLMDIGSNRGRPIRLTRAEYVALTAALDQIGVAPDDALRQKVRSLCGADSLSATDINRSIEAVTNRPDHDVILTCSEAIIDSMDLSFRYQGTNDSSCHQRDVRPHSLSMRRGSWILEAYDYRRRGTRSFRTDRMADLVICDLSDSIESTGTRVSSDDRAKTTSGTHLVTLYFSDPAFLTILEWPHITVLTRTPECITARIPYYENGDWLPHHIAACGGTITTDDQTLSLRVRECARHLLRAQTKAE